MPERAPLAATLAALAALAPVAAAADPRSRFEVGLFGVPADAPVATLRAAGFSLIAPSSKHPEEQLRLCRSADRAGLAFLGHPAELLTKPPRLPCRVAGWFLTDEPEVNGVSSAAVAGMRARVGAWDPGTPTAVTLGSGDAASRYRASADILMLDWYPVPHLPLATFAAQLRAALALSGGTPVWAVLQAIDWRSYPQRDKAKARVGRFPSQGEMRFMSYAALAEGAAGVMFFTFQTAAGETLLEAPERWHAVAAVARELAALKPFLDEGPGAPLSAPALVGRRWTLPGRELRVLVNPGETPVPLPEELAEAPWKLLFEPRLALARDADGQPPALKGYRALVFVR